MINLITKPWLPVLRASGATGTVRPSDLTDGFSDDPITTLAFSRPDWNGAVTEFLIGLYAVTMPVKDASAWLKRWHSPPSPEDMAEAMAPLVFAFDLMGDGPRCFQDLDPLAGAKVMPVQQLLIDAPGGNTAKLNQDLFIRRRGEGQVLAWEDVAAALITLQTFAPSGGAGHRTSMRGGGPLTTLIRPRRNDQCVTLFDLILANLPRGDEQPSLDARLFPWLGETRTSAKGEVTTPEDVHPLQAFFAMPRRLRLEGGSKGCAGFRTVPRGVNYAGWQHPLSPYYQNKEEWLPVHPREGTPTFRDWPGIWGAGEGRRAATCITAFKAVRDREWVAADLLAYGYDMDNAKARAWEEVRVPLLLDERDRLRATDLVESANEAASALRFAAKRALYGQDREKEGKVEIYLPDTVPTRACAELSTELELSMEAMLRSMVAFLKDKSPAEREGVFLAWHHELRGTALRLYDRTVGIRNVATDDLTRIVRARGGLEAAFAPKGKVAKALGIGERLKRQRENREMAE